MRLRDADMADERSLKLSPPPSPKMLIALGPDRTMSIQ